MKKILSKAFLLALFILNLLTLLLDWQVIPGVTFQGGLLVLTSNLWLSLIIVGMYGISIVFYEKRKKLFFTTGLCALSALFALEFSRFERYGRFRNSAIGVYLGLLTIIVNIVFYIIILKKETLSVDN